MTKPSIASRHPPQAYRDLVLRPISRLSVLFLSSTTVRMTIALLYLLPAYIIVKTIEVLPSIYSRWHLLLAPGGREQLVKESDQQRAWEEDFARKQYNRSCVLSHEGQIFQTDAKKCLREAHWSPDIDRFSLCGVDVGVVHEKPEKVTGRPIVLLHGNPSWSFMWRNVIPHLTQQGHEVYALDWIGHGLSDKPSQPSMISFELHMRTLQAFLAEFNVTNCCIAAHDWGGCVALSTLPHLPQGTCTSLFLLNTFFPPRPTDITIHSYMLYLLWFFSTGIFDGYLPEWAVMRYMSPQTTSRTMDGYCAPFAAGVATKASVSRFAHIVPGIPDFVLSLRDHYLWRMVEGLLGPTSFTNITAQARLAERNRLVRSFWAEPSEKLQDEVRSQVMVAFGRDDPLLVDFKDVLVHTIEPNLQRHAVGGEWIERAGHYPTEDRPLQVARLIQRFVQASRPLTDGSEQAFTT
ncbi:Epoxide hydrolase-like [Lasallia pustulata]|uniref:Epoxide hydrolase-like n=1 Tax=Lasallia pustulata TaxID=136370 RepID=A0A1W5D8U0_9LECA|nr:Epoxide hydrolase-like [Lasallia pustulata]